MRRHNENIDRKYFSLESNIARNVFAELKQKPTPYMLERPSCVHRFLESYYALETF